MPPARAGAYSPLLACLAYLKARRHVHEHQSPVSATSLASPRRGAADGDRRAAGDTPIRAPRRPRTRCVRCSCPCPGRENVIRDRQPPHKGASSATRTVAAPSSAGRAGPWHVDFPEPDTLEEHDYSSPGARRPGPRQLLATRAGISQRAPRRPIEQLAELAVRQLVPAHPSRSAERPAIPRPPVRRTTQPSARISMPSLEYQRQRHPN